MTNNFQVIRDFLIEQFSYLSGCVYSSKVDAFYNVALIGRKKDNSLVIGKVKSYTINTIYDLDAYQQEIITICDALKVRAYISVNYKSHKQVTLDAMVEYANDIAQDCFNNSRGIYDSVVAKFVDRSKQLWIIDVDKDDSFDKSVDELTDLYIKTIESCKPYKKIVTVIPTKSGKHIITHPFDASEFYLKIGELVKLGSNLIKKNDMTLLYENT